MIYFKMMPGSAQVFHLATATRKTTIPTHVLTFEHKEKLTLEVFRKLPKRMIISEPATRNNYDPTTTVETPIEFVEEPNHISPDARVSLTGFPKNAQSLLGDLLPPYNPRRPGRAVVQTRVMDKQCEELFKCLGSLNHTPLLKKAEPAPQGSVLRILRQDGLLETQGQEVLSSEQSDEPEDELLNNETNFSINVANDSPDYLSDVNTHTVVNTNPVQDEPPKSSTITSEDFLTGLSKLGGCRADQSEVEVHCQSHSLQSSGGCDADGRTVPDGDHSFTRLGEPGAILVEKMQMKTWLCVEGGRGGTWGRGDQTVPGEGKWWEEPRLDSEAVEESTNVRSAGETESDEESERDCVYDKHLQNTQDIFTSFTESLKRKNKPKTSRKKVRRKQEFDEVSGYEPSSEESSS